MADSVNLSNLSEGQRETLEQYMAVVEDQDQASAIALLQRSQWNLEVSSHSLY